MKNKIKFFLPLLIVFIALSASCINRSSKKSDDMLKISTTENHKFDPSVLNVKVGDVVHFNIGPTHTATRVTKADWDANLPNSDGGFDFGPGEHTYTIQPSDGGTTIYYVCKYHVQMHEMKGMIVVAK